MHKKKIRDLAEMPTINKFQYFQVLFTMANIDGEINQLELMVLYYLMGRVKLPQKERLLLLDYFSNFSNFSEEIMTLCQEMMKDLKDQEKNIMRFSLMKDLVIVMGADYYETLEEKELFNRLKLFLDVQDEHLDLIQEEYKKDRNYFYEDCMESIRKNRWVERISMAAAIGIPTTTLFIKRRNIEKNHYFHRRKSGVSAIDVLKTFSLGIGSYYGLRWLLGIKDTKERKLKQYLYEECLKVRGRAIKYLIADHRYLQQMKLTTKEDKNNHKSMEKSIRLLEKAFATFENTEPYLL